MRSTPHDPSATAQPAPTTATPTAAAALPAPAPARTEPARTANRPADTAVTWVAQAGPAFSAAHVEDNAADIVARMLPLLCDQLGVTADRVTLASAHRWRYAQVAAPLGQPFLRDAGALLYLGGDWCLGRRVEDAWTSGTAIANDLLAQRC